MIIALNNKSNLGKKEFLSYQKELETITSNFTIILCPTFLNINLCKNNKIHIGSQDVSETKEGAYTGEICAKHLKESNVEYCIVGHSERREYQKEDYKVIRDKIARLIENDITPILCIGESKKERENQQVKAIIEEELLSAISGLTTNEIKRIIIAYEPIWSIGTGIIPTIEEIEEAFHYIKNILPHNKIIYGGSANKDNIDVLKQSAMIDGYLLGGLSLKTKDLQVFINKLEK